MIRILAINGSYRDDGVTDRAVDCALAAARAAGAAVEQIRLREYPIEFCLNCRECTQPPGEAPAACVLDDGMRALVEKIEAADALILAAPTNFGSVTALFKRFMERLAVYAYWSWGGRVPSYRKAGLASRKPALLISSSAAPALLARWAFGSLRQLRATATLLGADVAGSLLIGSTSAEPQPPLAEAQQARLRKLAARLLR